MALGFPLFLLLVVTIFVIVSILIVCFLVGLGVLGTGITLSVAGEKTKTKAIKPLGKAFLVLGIIAILGVLSVVAFIGFSIVNKVSFNNNSLIAYATSEDEEGYNKLLNELKNGAEVDSNYNMIRGNYKAEEGEDTPLSALCSLNKYQTPYYDSAKILIEYGADVNHIGNNGKPPILNAAENRHHNIVFLLIENGADITVVDKNGATILMYEVMDFVPFGNDFDKMISNVNYVIDNGVDINAVDKDGKNALHYSFSVTGSSEITEILLSNGIDVNSADKDGKTPLMYAAENAYYEVFNILKEYDVEINKTDNEGKNALMYCCMTGDEYENALWLVENGADVNAVDNKGKTALIHACENYYREDGVEMVRILTDAGCDVNAVDKTGKTALFYAIDDSIHNMGFRYEMSLLLIENGADVTVTDKNGKNLLMRICEGRIGGGEIYDIIPVMLEKGIDINATDNNGKTALVCLAENHLHTPEGFEMLLKNGAKGNYEEIYQKVKANRFISKDDKEQIYKLLDEYLK